MHGAADEHDTGGSRSCVAIRIANAAVTAPADPTFRGCRAGSAERGWVYS
jgi:hypothetical protein